MHIAIALGVGFIVGAALASLYHTRIDSAAANLRQEKAILEVHLNDWKNRALEAADEVGALRAKIEARIALEASKASSELKKL